MLPSHQLSMKKRRVSTMCECFWVVVVEGTTLTTSKLLTICTVCMNLHTKLQLVADCLTGVSRKQFNVS